MIKALSFEEVLQSEHKHLVEAIEHGSSDPEVMEWLYKELELKTGYSYKF